MFGGTKAVPIISAAGTIDRMSAKPWTSRVALWAAVCVLLLKAAVPMLASAAAALQGVSVAEVCTVYGVAIPDPHAAHGAHAGEHAHHHHGQGHDHSGHALAAHAGDHCALTALAALAAPDAPVTDVPAPAPAVLHVAQAVCQRSAPDDCALWAARLKHGPPLSA